jgi:hypothetical protein
LYGGSVSIELQLWILDNESRVTQKYGASSGSVT